MIVLSSNLRGLILADFVEERGVRVDRALRTDFTERPEGRRHIRFTCPADLRSARSGRPEDLTHD